MCFKEQNILEQRPAQHIFNVGNKETVSVRDWVFLCYQTVGKNAEFVTVNRSVNQRNYFSFYDYEYYLDVTSQEKLMPETEPLEAGLKKSWEWYQTPHCVSQKPFIQYIDTTLI